MTYVLEGTIFEVHSERAVIEHEKYGKLKFGTRSESTHLQHLSYRYKIGDRVVFLLPVHSQTPSMVCLASRCLNVCGLVTEVNGTGEEINRVQVITPSGTAVASSSLLAAPTNDQVSQWDVVKVRVIPTSDRHNAKFQIAEIKSLFPIKDADKQPMNVKTNTVSVQAFAVLPPSPNQLPIERHQSQANMLLMSKSKNRDDMKLQLTQMGKSIQTDDHEVDVRRDEWPKLEKEKTPPIMKGISTIFSVDSCANSETLLDPNYKNPKQRLQRSVTPAWLDVEQIGEQQSQDFGDILDLGSSEDKLSSGSPGPIITPDTEIEHKSSNAETERERPKFSIEIFDEPEAESAARKLARLCLLDDEIYDLLLRKLPAEVRQATKFLLKENDEVV